MPDRYEWVSVHEASRRLGRSVSTIRRQIESGELVGEREPLARGSTRDRYRVRLDAPESPDVTHHDAPPPSTNEASVTPQDAPATTTRALDVLAEMTQAQSRQLIAQAETIADLREERGRLQAERDAAVARATAAEAELQRLRGRSLWKPWTW